MTKSLWRDPAPMLKAKSVAILGASPSSPWLPIFIEQFTQAKYRGPLWLVNPGYEKIGDMRCSPSIGDLPQIPEHLLVLLGAERVLPALEEATAAGVKSATLYSIGWGESDHAGKERERALRALIGRTGLLVCGPNGLGSASVREGLIAYPLRVMQWLHPGNIGVVFQSGAMLQPFLRCAGERGAGFTYIISCGNECGPDLPDYVRFLVDDPETRAIALLIEGVRYPDKFRAALDMARSAGKPVAVLKVSRGDRSQASTLTHTGALAGSQRVLEVLCRQYGVALVDGLDQLIESVRVLAGARRPAGRRAAMLVYSGSLRSQLLDQCAERGVELAVLSPKTIEKLAAIAPLDLRIQNPLDCGHHWTRQQTYLDFAQTMIDDPGVDLLYIEKEAPDPVRRRSAAAVAALAASTDKPVIGAFDLPFSMTPYAQTFISESNIPFAFGIDRATAAIGHLMDFSECQRAAQIPRPAPVARALPALSLPAGVHGAGAIGDALAGYGIRLAPQQLARSEDEAVSAAAALGYPVALKIESPDISHKSEAGGVRLDLADANALRQAWRDVQRQITDRAPAARVAGMLVARMAAPGLEMSIGVQRDAQFGLTLMAGLGGVWIEVFADVSLRLLPIDDAQAQSMLAELKAAPLLGSFRGTPARDVKAIVGAMRALARFAADQGDRFASVEINPLIVYAEGDGATAVDARLVLT